MTDELLYEIESCPRLDLDIRNAMISRVIYGSDQVRKLNPNKIGGYVIQFCLEIKHSKIYSQQFLRLLCKILQQCIPLKNNDKIKEDYKEQPAMWENIIALKKAIAFLQSITSVKPTSEITSIISRSTSSKDGTQSDSSHQGSYSGTNAAGSLLDLFSSGIKKLYYEISIAPELFLDEKRNINHDIIDRRITELKKLILKELLK